MMGDTGPGPLMKPTAGPWTLAGPQFATVAPELARKLLPADTRPAMPGPYWNMYNQE